MHPNDHLDLMLDALIAEDLRAARDAATALEHHLVHDHGQPPGLALLGKDRATALVVAACHGVRKPAPLTDNENPPTISIDAPQPPTPIPQPIRRALRKVVRTTLVHADPLTPSIAKAAGQLIKFFGL